MVFYILYRIGGLHIMQTFTNKVPASFDMAPYVKGIAYEGELELIYTIAFMQ